MGGRHGASMASTSFCIDDKRFKDDVPDQLPRNEFPASDGAPSAGPDWASDRRRLRMFFMSARWQDTLGSPFANLRKSEGRDKLLPLRSDRAYQARDDAGNDAARVAFPFHDLAFSTSGAVSRWRPRYVHRRQHHARIALASPCPRVLCHSSPRPDAAVHQLRRIGRLC